VIEDGAGIVVGGDDAGPLRIEPVVADALVEKRGVAASAPNRCIGAATTHVPWSMNSRRSTAPACVTGSEYCRRTGALREHKPSASRILFLASSGWSYRCPSMA